MTDKPKRKNLSPDELLQQAKLLHPENEAFVRGETKELHPIADVYSNLYFQHGLPIDTKNLGLKQQHQKVTCGCLITPFAIFFCGVLFTFGDYQYSHLSPPFCWGSFFLFFITATGVFNLWRYGRTTEAEVQSQITRMIQDGSLISGWVKRIKAYSTNWTQYQIEYVTPFKAKSKRLVWYTKVEKPLANGEQVVLLYLNDKCVIVL